MESKELNPWNNRDLTSSQVLHSRARGYGYDKIRKRLAV